MFMESSHFAGICVLAALVAGPVPSPAQGSAALKGAEYTADQAALGKPAYDRSCSNCHGSNLDGGFGPSLKTTSLAANYRTLDSLFTVISTRMPPSNPGSLGAEASAQVLAFLLQANGVNAGSRPLPSDPRLLAAMTLSVPQG